MGVAGRQAAIERRIGVRKKLRYLAMNLVKRRCNTPASTAL